MKAPLHIIKIGGRLINDPKSLDAFLNAFQRVSTPKILVHGGGRKATELSALLGIETRMIDGRRITNKETLEVAVMVYAGLINKTIVARLQALDINAIGLSGADADTVRATKRPVREVDYGYVGDIERVADGALQALLNSGITPVLCAISHDGSGQLLNTNADTIAAQVAIALSTSYQVHLSYCFEYPGVLYDIDAPELTMSTISEGEFINMKTSGTVNSGMIPKLSNGFDSLKGGVHEVHVCGIDNLTTRDRATLLHL